MRSAWLAVSLAAVAAGCGASTGLEAPDGAPSERRDDGGTPDVCIELPPREPPKSIEVSFFTRISRAELHFLVDVTSSMGQEINQIRWRLGDTILPGIQDRIGETRVSVGRYADFALDPYGSTEDELFVLEQASTDDTALVQTALDRLALQHGGDGPEATVEALHVVAAGARVPGYVRLPDCPPDTDGYPCFRPEGSRVVLLFTDAAFHNGPGGSDPYEVSFETTSYETMVEELRRAGIKVLGLYSGEHFDSGFEQLQQLARDSGSVRPDGTPVVIDIGSEAETLGPDVVEAVRTLVEEVTIDVDAFVEDEPGDAIDAASLVTRIVALRAEPADGATLLGDRFDDVRPDTRVTFSIELANARIERTGEPQRYRMTVVLRGDGVTRLSETVVDVVIPSLDGEGCD